MPIIPVMTIRAISKPMGIGEYTRDIMTTSPINAPRPLIKKLMRQPEILIIHVRAEDNAAPAK